MQRGLVSSESHQGNSDLSAEAHAARGDQPSKDWILAFRVRRPVAARFLAMFAKVGTTKRDHTPPHERSAESGRAAYTGPNGRRAWIRVADLRTAKDGEWAVTSGCQFRHCPAGHDSAVQQDVNAEPRVSGVWGRHNAGRGCWVVVERFEDRPCTAVAVTSIPLRPLKLTEVVDSLGLPKLRRSSMTERELE